VDVQELIAEARDAMTARRVYGEPYEREGVTIIPAAAVRGGSGGGSGRGGDGEGGGGGFGLAARPVGAWVITDEGATWKPAIDVNRIVLGGQMIGLAAVVFLGRLLLARSRAGRTRR
jgi:uncharacterized spore protein YtfJ